MSMIGNFRLTTDAEIEVLLADPERVTDVVYPEQERAEEGTTLDVDKAWHGIHFLLTGTAWEGDGPLAFVLGGAEIGDVDVGYGPARALRAGEVREIAAALGAVTADALRARFDAAAFARAEVYPRLARGEDPADHLEYLLSYFETLKAFVQRAGAGGFGLLVYLN